MRPRQLIFICALLIATWTLGRAEASADLEITIHVYDYAGIEPDRVTGMELFAGRILERAGITAKWSDCRLTGAGMVPVGGCTGSAAGGTHLIVRLLPEWMARKLPTSRMLGMSLPTSKGTFPADAYVFVERVARLGEQQGQPVPALLGAGIAHEIGHLLLGGEDHTVAGIMRAQLGPREMTDVTMGVLTFSSQQAQQMRADVRRRTARERLSAAK
jgi:hypothetical protein